MFAVLLLLSFISQSFLFLQCTAGIIPSKFTALQRRTDIDADVDQLPYDPDDRLAFNNITCESGMGGECVNDAQDAMAQALQNFARAIIYDIDQKFFSTNLNQTFGMDSKGNIVASIAYALPSSANFTALAAFTGAVLENPDALASSIVFQMADSSLNRIEACYHFTLDGGRFVGGSGLALLGWNDFPYLESDSVLQTWLENCQEVVIPQPEN